MLLYLSRLKEKIMKKEYLEKSQIKFTFEVSKEHYNEVENSYKNENKEQDLKEVTLNKLFQENFEEILKDEEVNKKIVGYPKPEVVEFSDEKIVLSLTIDLYPEFDLPEYKGIKVSKKNVEVSEDEVNALVNALVSQNLKPVTKEEQVIEKMDYAVFDFLGTVDGVPFEGGAAENYEMQIGSGQFIPGFEDQMIGMKKDEVKDVKVTFPENYTEELKGKDAVFKVTVHEVKVMPKLELNDEFAKSLNIENVNTVSELKEAKRQELLAKKEQDETSRQIDQIIETILSNTKVDVPESLILAGVNSFKAQYENQAKMYGIPFETFLQMMGVDLERFNQIAYANAYKQVLFTLVGSKIIEVEKLAPTQEDIYNIALNEANKTNTDVNEILKRDSEQIYSFLSQQRLIMFLLENKVEY
jgi:trigger factor